jgi:glycosyltransferase involved in cell wall biosynthesis
VVRETEVRALRRRLKLPEDRPVLLYVGGIDQRKNVPFLLEVFRRVLAEAPAERRPVLVLVGSIEHDANYPALLKQIVRLNLSADVVVMGRLSDEELVGAYQASDLFVFPSLYEGFGFPVVEAFACGVPVIAGANSSILEVAAGGGASLLPDNEAEVWVREILSLLAVSVTKRIELGKEGVSRAREFSWERTAALTLEAYRFFGERVTLRGGVAAHQLVEPPGEDERSR